MFSTLGGSGGSFSPVDINFTASGKVQRFCHNLRKDAKFAERQIKGGSKFVFYGKLGNSPSVDAVDGHHAKTSAVDGFSNKNSFKLHQYHSNFKVDTLLAFEIKCFRNKQLKQLAIYVFVRCISIN